MFWWDGFMEMGLPPMPIWFDVTEDSCRFSIGKKDNEDPKAIGDCTVDDDETPIHPTLTFNDGNTAMMNKVESFEAGEWEPEGVNKWTDGDSVYVWEVAHKEHKKEHEHREHHEKKNDEWTPFIFYWTGFEEMGLPPLPVWFDVTEDSCKFSIGEKDSKKPESVGTCTIDREAMTGEMTFHDGNTAALNVVDDFGAGDLEPEADMKWTDGGEVYLWLINDHDKKRDPTPFMFYWTGMKEMNLPPLPIWFDLSEDSCSFVVGDQYSHKDEAHGTCTIDEEAKTGTMTFADGSTVSVNAVDDFGAGELEPEAVSKWTDGSEIYVWQTESAKHSHEHHHKVGHALHHRK
jgi:hypothetical protein